MKKILKELIENFPELEKEKEGIEKAVYYLKDNKPVFSTSKEFKKNLKNRLKNISSIKSQKKSPFLVFAVPVFSFLFIVVWFTYYFKQINFLNDIENISTWLYDNDSLEKEWLILKEDIKSVNENISNNELDSNSKSSKIIQVENTNSIFPSEKNIQAEKDNFIDPIKSNDSMFYESEKSKKIIVDNNDNNSYENDDISTILWAVWEMYPETGDWFINHESMPYVWDSGVWFERDSMMMKTTSFYMVYEEEYMSFEDYCLSNSWSILQNEKAKLCRVKQKYCLSSDYINWVCEFKEIK